MQTVLVEKKANDEEKEFYDNIVRDAKQSLIQFVSDRGHGKSTSLKNIVAKCKENDPNMQFIATDVSQSWYKKAPMQYRQLVTREKMKAGQVANVIDCVYEIGSMTEDEQRAFIGIIMGQHYEKRYKMSLESPEEFEKLPWLVFILEEANLYFNSYSMTKNDAFSPIFKKFVSVGRNYKLGAFLITTAEEGEISPSLRRRSRRIYGRLIGEGDIARVKKVDKQMGEYLAKEIPRFTFIYWGTRFFGPVRVKDTVTNVPVDYIMQTPPIKSTIGSWWLVQLLLGAFFMAMFIWFLTS